MSYQVKIEKLIARPTHEVFKALAEGRLFMNCSADSNSIKVDFKVGGKYHLDFKNHKVANWGEFLEIIPDRKIVFTWCQDFGPEQKPDTQVTIELFPDGTKTKLVLEHTGFRDKANCDGHYEGWNGGINDLTSEMQNGKLRMVRRYSVSVEKLYQACTQAETFFNYMGDTSNGKVDFKTNGQYNIPSEKGGVHGEFLEIHPNKKIVMSWFGSCGNASQDCKVELTFHKKDDGTSSIEINHHGFLDATSIHLHRQGWDSITSRMLADFDKTN